MTMQDVQDVQDVFHSYVRETKNKIILFMCTCKKAERHPSEPSHPACG
jgi:hypothetical protein